MQTVTIFVATNVNNDEKNYVSCPSIGNGYYCLQSSDCNQPLIDGL